METCRGFLICRVPPIHHRCHLNRCGVSPGNPNKPRAIRGRRLSGLIALVTPRKLLRTSWHTRERQHPSHVGRPKGDAMRLPTLKTSALPMLDSRRVTTLEAKAGATERLSGGAWETVRQRVKERDRHVCAACGRVRGDHEVDHRTPVEQGGSNDMTNLQLLCSGVGNCHDVKTRAEARQRAGGMLKV